MHRVVLASQVFAFFGYPWSQRRQQLSPPEQDRVRESRAAPLEDPSGLDSTVKSVASPGRSPTSATAVALVESRGTSVGTTEWVLLVLVILVPLVIAVAVTLWTLEQARLRSRQNRKTARKRRDSRPPTDDAS